MHFLRIIFPEKGPESKYSRFCMLHTLVLCHIFFSSFLQLFKTLSHGLPTPALGQHSSHSERSLEHLAKTGGFFPL